MITIGSALPAICETQKLEVTTSGTSAELLTGHWPQTRMMGPVAENDIVETIIHVS